MDYIGYLISFLALIYLFFKQQSIAKHRPKPMKPIPSEEEEGEFLEDVFQPKKAKKKVPLAAKPARLPPPSPQAKPIGKKAAPRLEEYHLESAIEKRQLKSSLEGRQLKPSIKSHLEEDLVKGGMIHVSSLTSISQAPSKAKVALSRLAHKKDLAIYQEIIAKPKSLR